MREPVDMQIDLKFAIALLRSREYIVYRRSMSSGRVGGDPSQVKSAVRRE